MLLHIRSPFLFSFDCLVSRHQINFPKHSSNLARSFYYYLKLRLWLWCMLSHWFGVVICVSFERRYIYIYISCSGVFSFISCNGVFWVPFYRWFIFSRNDAIRNFMNEMKLLFCSVGCKDGSVFPVYVSLW